MKIEQIAINGITTQTPPFPETLHAYAKAGFRNIEMPLGRVKEWLQKGHSVAEAKAVFDDLGLRFIGGFEAHVAVFASAEEQAKNHALHRANAELIAELGGGGVLVAGTDGPEKKSVEALPTVGETFAHLVEQFPSSVSLALEFNWSPLVKSLRGALTAVKAADHPRVGILFDPAHYHCTPTRLEDLTRETVRYISHVHVNDMRDKPGDLSDCNADRVLPGEGILDLTALFGRIEEFGYAGYFSLELFNADIWALPPDEAALQCYTAMRRLTQDA